MVKLPEEENTPDKRVNKIFDVMDKVTNSFTSYVGVVRKVLGLNKKTSSRTDPFYIIFQHSPPELQCTLTTDESFAIPSQRKSAV